LIPGSIARTQNKGEEEQFFITWTKESDEVE